MAQIVWSREALHWLRDIHDYIAADSPTIAQKVATDIHEKAQTLAHFPKAGDLYRTATDQEIRILLYGHYRIAYLLGPSSDIAILGVFHGALDIDRYFP